MFCLSEQLLRWLPKYCMGHHEKEQVCLDTVSKPCLQWVRAFATQWQVQSVPATHHRIRYQFWQWPNGHTALDILDPYVMAVGLTASVQYFKQKTSRQILWLRMLRWRSTQADVLMVRWKLASCKAKKGVWILQCCRVPWVGLFFLQPFSDLWASPLAFVDSRNQ